jgi:hypothetical protein
MSEPEAKLTAYQKRCKEACPDAEEMVQTVSDMGQDVLDARAERDQWREKFEQRGEELAVALRNVLMLREQLAARDQEIARLREALEHIAEHADWMCYAHTGDEHEGQCSVATARAALTATAQPSAGPTEQRR